MQLDRISKGADPVGSIEAFKRGIKGVFDYRGVAPRSEFWTLVAIMYCLLGVCVIMTPAKSGWWLLIGMSGIGLCLLIWWWSLPGIAQEK